MDLFKDGFSYEEEDINAIGLIPLNDDNEETLAHVARITDGDLEFPCDIERMNEFLAFTFTTCEKEKIEKDNLERIHIESSQERALMTVKRRDLVYSPREVFSILGSNYVERESVEEYLKKNSKIKCDRSLNNEYVK